MTREEKVEAYDKAIEKAKTLYNSVFVNNDVLEQIFPELNEHEMIRKDLIQWINEFPDIIWRGHYTKDVITWLKKQGEQKPVNKKYTFNAIPRLLDMIQPTDKAKAYCQKLIDSFLQEGYSVDAKIVDSCLKQMNGEKVTMATMDEQKSADVIEPKFHEGDTIRLKNSNAVYVIESISNGRYYGKGFSISIAGGNRDYELVERYCVDNIEHKSAEWIEDYWQHHKILNPDSYNKGEEIQFDHDGFVRFCKQFQNPAK